MEVWIQHYDCRLKAVSEPSLEQCLELLQSYDWESEVSSYEQALEEGEVVTVAGTGSQGFVDGAGDSAQFRFPIGLAMSPDGTYALVADDGAATSTKRAPALRASQ